MELDRGALTYGIEIAAYALAMLIEAERLPVRAYETLRLYWQLDADQQIRRFHRYLAPPLICLALTLDHPEVATAVADAVEEGAALATDVPSMRAVARRCRGLVGGDPETMLEAVELVRLGPRVADQVVTLEDAARVLASAGRTTEAQSQLLGALELCDQLAATAWQCGCGPRCVTSVCGGTCVEPADARRPAGRASRTPSGRWRGSLRKASRTVRSARGFSSHPTR